MRVDFTPVRSEAMTMADFAARFTIADLRAATNASLDAIVDLLHNSSDHDIAFMPVDEEAYDPFAIEGETYLTWNLGHLVAHVTASSEEGAAFGSLLARGVPIEDEELRLRYETPWREVATREAALHRLNESRRIRLAYLETWPDPPHLDVHRRLSADFEQRLGKINAPASVLFGLMHEDEHLSQMQAVKQQAEAARTAST